MSEPDRAPDPEVARLAFELARDRVNGQRASLDELRSRASGLLGAAAIATSFLAGFALDNRTEDLTWFSWAGFLGAGVTAVLLLTVLWPTPDWKLGHHPQRVLDFHYLGQYEGSSGPRSLEQAHSAIARDMAVWVNDNAEKQDGLFKIFRWAVLAVGAMVVSWIADLLVINF